MSLHSKNVLCKKTWLIQFVTESALKAEESNDTVVSSARALVSHSPCNTIKERTRLISSGSLESVQRQLQEILFYFVHTAVGLGFFSF